ncbi:MAG: hypothetical protein H7332_07675 [Bdellovibrionales bacterium]|nr:hypothetical protein [Ramlibacter sp.]
MSSTPECATLTASDALNSACFCLNVDKDALAHALDSELGRPGLAELVRQRCPFMFAARAVFVAAPQLQRMAEVVRAVESVVQLPAYREQVLSAAPAIARLGSGGPLGAFFGYDFHVSHGQLGLIEINTNAGGAMLNAVLARAQRVCCAATDGMVPTHESVAAFESSMVEMFRHEWRLAGNTRPLGSIAIVDEAPEEQYLYPEFLLFQQLFERHGLRAVIAGPQDFEWRDGRLWHAGLAIDLVYNRLTDFYLEQPASAVLREAYEQQGVVLTPHPQAHALYANKRNLVTFSDAAQLQALGASETSQRILLEHVPHTELVKPADAQRLWDARRSLFFKPVAGFGSRAAYRGDKLTRRVWQDILAGDYVAQAIVSPGERITADEGDGQAMKFDLRAFTYDGAVQWTAARLYQGQTTNFRTPGGGFAPVYSTGDSTARSLAATDTVRSDEPAYASYIFLLDESGGVHPIPHSLYVALARGQADAPSLAGRTLRLADWYVRMNDGQPGSVVNETYHLVHFDPTGKVDWQASPAPHPHRLNDMPVPQEAALPTTAERAAIRSILSGGTATAGT